MQENIYSNNYFFVDESGDTTFYNRKGKWIVGSENGASKILLMGFIRTTEPEFLRKKLNELKYEVLNDEYLKDIPSMSKTKIAFHAKDDCPEVRYKVFTLLKELPFSCNIVVARKTEHVFKKFNGNTQELYDSLITNLFKNILHLSNNNYIYIASILACIYRYYILLLLKETSIFPFFTYSFNKQLVVETRFGFKLHVPFLTYASME